MDHRERALRRDPPGEHLAGRSRSESTWLNGTYLVLHQDGDERDRRFLRARDLGIGDEYVVLDADGRLATHLDTDAGQLFVATTVNDGDGAELEVRSALQPLRDEVFSRPLEWSQLCGVSVERIEQLARDFTSRGKQATASFYRGGVCQFTGGLATRPGQRPEHVAGFLERRRRHVRAQHRDNTSLGQRARRGAAMVSDTRGRAMVLAAPPAVVVSMLALFRLLRDRCTPRTAYNLGFAVYWLVWCLAVPLALLGRRRTLHVLRTGRPPTWPQRVALLVPVVGGVATELWPNRSGIDPSVGAVMLASAAVNAVGEELLWRGTFIELVPDDTGRGATWSLIWFASGIWHRSWSCRPGSDGGGSS